MSVHGDSLNPDALDRAWDAYCAARDDGDDEPRVVMGAAVRAYLSVAGSPTPDEAALIARGFSREHRRVRRMSWPSQPGDRTPREPGWMDLEPRMREVAIRDARVVIDLWTKVSSPCHPETDTVAKCRAPHCWSEYGTPCGDCPSEPRPENPYRGDTACFCPDDWREPFDKAWCPQHGGAAYESERSKHWREGSVARQPEIDALRTALEEIRRDQSVRPGSWVHQRAIDALKGTA